MFRVPRPISLPREEEEEEGEEAEEEPTSLELSSASCSLSTWRVKSRFVSSSAFRGDGDETGNRRR